MKSQNNNTANAMRRFTAVVVMTVALTGASFQARGDGLRRLTPEELDRATAPSAALQRLSEQCDGDLKVSRDDRKGTIRQLKGAMLQPATASPRSGEADSMATAREFLRRNNALLGVTDPDAEIEMTSRKTGPLGKTHIRFRQHSMGIPVWPSQLSVHLDESGNVEMLDGSYIRTPAIDTTPTLSANEVAERAEKSADLDGAHVEDSELIVFAPADDSAPRLAFKMSVHGAKAHEHRTVVIDAHTGETLMSFSDICTASVQGSGQDLFGQTRPLMVSQNQQTGMFEMLDQSRASFNPQTGQGGIVVLDAENTSLESGNFIEQFASSTQPNGGWVPDAVSAMFGLAKTVDYYTQVRQRNSLDGNGGTVIAVVRYDQNYLNAHWDPQNQAMFFGDAVPFAGALDVVAHELTHGVTDNESGLVYQFQSGALDEAMSDIFGEVVERNTFGQNDWLKGADLGSPIQDFVNPNSVIIEGLNVPHPARMSQFLNLTIDTDNGGVHLNSAIINHCFYLLAEGMQGAIGMDDAADIFYRANTTHLGPDSDFVDCRLACVASAEELFGANSQQAAMTAAAFDAVEIFENGTGTGADSNNNGADDEFEENDSIDQAKPITAGTHSLQGLDDDFFVIEVTAAGTMEISISGPTGDLDLVLYDTQGTPVAASDAPNTSNEGLGGDVSPGVIIARVVPFQGQTSSYTLTLTLPGSVTQTPGDPNDDVFEENDTIGAATPIKPGSYQAMGLDTDVFTFSLPSPQSVAITVQGPQGDLDMCLLDGAGQPLICSENEQTNEAIEAELPAGQYFIFVAPYAAGTTSSYTLTLAAGSSTTTAPGTAGCGAGTLMMSMAMAVGMLGLGTNRRRPVRRRRH